MATESRAQRSDLLQLTSEIVSAHVSNNDVDLSLVPELIQSVFDKLAQLANGEEAAPAEPTPAVPIRRSVTNDHIVCLEDGKKMKMLKRHLMTDHGMTPGEYRTKWGLKSDYPMVAPDYAAKRRELAVKAGLGRKQEKAEPAAPKRKSGRKVATKPRAKKTA